MSDSDERKHIGPAQLPGINPPKLSGDNSRVQPAALSDEVVARIRDGITRWARGRLTSISSPDVTVEDVVHSALVEALSKDARIFQWSEASLSSYLRSLVSRRLVDEARRASRQEWGRREKTVTPTSEGETDPASDEELLAKQRVLLATLSSEEREAIRLRVELNMAVHDVALVLTDGNVPRAHHLIQRAFRRLHSANTLLADPRTSMGSETQPADGATGLESLPQLLSEWTSSCRDAWLRRELSGLLRQPTTWKQLVAAGMLTSSQALHGDDAHRFARQALAGHVPHDLASVRTWSRQLSATDVARLEQIAVHEAASLRREIYENDPEPESESDLIALWAPFAHRRADIEGVRALLLGANHAPDLLDRILEDIDVAGSALRFALPVEMPIVNERLQRVSSARPDAWWGASFHALLGF